MPRTTAHSEDEELVLLSETAQHQHQHQQQQQERIPRHEQDEDLWRYAVVPGRDPVTGLKGPEMVALGK